MSIIGTSSSGALLLLACNLRCSLLYGNDAYHMTKHFMNDVSSSSEKILNLFCVNSESPNAGSNFYLGIYLAECVLRANMRNHPEITRAAQEFWSNKMNCASLSCGGIGKEVLNPSLDAFDLCPQHRRCILSGYTNLTDCELEYASWSAAVHHLNELDLKVVHAPEIGLSSRVFNAYVSNSSKKQCTRPRCDSRCFNSMQEEYNAFNDDYNLIVQSVCFLLLGKLNRKLMKFLHNAVCLFRNIPGLESFMKATFGSNYESYLDWRTNRSLPYMSVIATLLQGELLIVFGTESPSVLSGWDKCTDSSNQSHGCFRIPYLKVY